MYSNNLPDFRTKDLADFLMFILPACCTSVDLVGNETFVSFTFYNFLKMVSEKIYQQTAARAALSCGSGIGSNLT
jgi:ribose 5-phosphate isomerase RpiB